MDQNVDVQSVINVLAQQIADQSVQIAVLRAQLATQGNTESSAPPSEG